MSDVTENLQDHPVLVVDFGAQYAQLIARRVRECALYSEVVPHTMSAAEMLAKEPAAIVLSGGPSSVYAEGAPSLDVALLEAGVPVFGICYGFQAMADALGGTVGHTGGREYGNTTATITHTESVLFAGQPAEQNVWMSHGDGVTEAPAGMTVCARTPGAPVAAFEDPARKLFGVQWHPEVLHSAHGQEVLRNFLLKGAGLEATWTAERLEILRAADLIAREELTAAGLDRDIWQCPVVLLADVRSVGVQGDGRTYGHPIVLRPVSSEDAMTADWTRLPYDVLAKISNRITNEVADVNRVVLDVTSKPPGTIEWE